MVLIASVKIGTSKMKEMFAVLVTEPVSIVRMRQAVVAWRAALPIIEV